MCALRIERAEETLREADENLASGHFSLAANRYYYACFHAVHALFVMNELYAKSHEGMSILFAKHFVKTGLFDAKFSSFGTRLENLREKADYEVLFSVTEADLRIYQPLTHELIVAIKNYLTSQK